MCTLCPCDNFNKPTPLHGFTTALQHITFNTTIIYLLYYVTGPVVSRSHSPRNMNGSTNMPLRYYIETIAPLQRTQGDYSPPKQGPFQCYHEEQHVQLSCEDDPPASPAWPHAAEKYDHTRGQNVTKGPTTGYTCTAGLQVTSALLYYWTIK